MTIPLGDAGSSESDATMATSPRGYSKERLLGAGISVTGGLVFNNVGSLKDDLRFNSKGASSTTTTTTTTTSTSTSSPLSGKNDSRELSLEDLLINSDFAIMNALMESMMGHRGEEPASSLFQLYRYHNKSLDLLRWSITQEFSHRREPREFLSRETLATNLLSLFLFDEFGISFLRDQLKPFIASLQDLSSRWETYDRSSATNHVEWHTEEFLTLLKVFLESLFNTVNIYP